MCPARTRTLRLRRDRITRVFGVCYPRTHNDVTNGSGLSELLILPCFQTSRSATCALIHDPPVTQARPAGLRECGSSLWSRFPALTCPRVRRPTTQPQYLLAQTGSFSRTAHDAKNLPIRAQYFCTTVSVLKCPPRAKRWSRIPALSANRLTDLHGTYVSSFAWNIRIFSGVSSLA